MVNAFKNLWISDNQVLSICPFLLAGEFWDLNSNQKHPIIETIVAMEVGHG